jgi:large subunit ribosomal protein L13
MTTKTYRLSAKQMDRRWHVIDASGRPLGRLASEAAGLLLGKHKPTYEPHLPMGDHVVIVNAEQVAITGDKRRNKVYYRHSGYPGGLRERTFEEQMARDPRRVIERAIKGMLPRNSRGRELFRHLKVYIGPEHPHEAQVAAGTGARARKRAAQEAKAAEVAAAAPAAETAPPPEVVAPEAEAPVVEPEAAEAAPEAVAEEAVERPTGALRRWRRSELDAEAGRLGITIEDGWRKDDVVEAIEAYRAEHPEEDE